MVLGCTATYGVPEGAPPISRERGNPSPSCYHLRPQVIQRHIVFLDMERLEDRKQLLVGLETEVLTPQRADVTHLASNGFSNC